ncbi:MAG: hypothetical protein GF418_13665 [Chitinivibrionales bacterium]|nr:hypothetical protein [Chitinivibrionales bacterium]MBD3396668.1 hypothetical protein [Chitinivibrionales bacterium]
MPPIPENPNIRKGQFLWKEEGEQKQYLKSLTQKISEGYYFSDTVLGEIVEELAPAFSDNVSQGGGPVY